MSYHSQGESANAIIGTLLGRVQTPPARPSSPLAHDPSESPLPAPALPPPGMPPARCPDGTVERWWRRPRGSTPSAPPVCIRVRVRCEHASVPACLLPVCRLLTRAPRSPREHCFPPPPLRIRVPALLAGERIMTAPMTARPLLLQRQQVRRHERRHLAWGLGHNPRGAQRSLPGQPIRHACPNHRVAGPSAALPRPSSPPGLTIHARPSDYARGAPSPWVPSQRLSTPPRKFVARSTGPGLSAPRAVCVGRLGRWISMSQRNGCYATSSACSPVPN